MKEIKKKITKTIKDKTKEKKDDIIDQVKTKLISIVSDYVREKIVSSKDEIIKYIEKEIEKKIKNEVKKVKNKLIYYSLLGIGIAFLIYGFVEILFFLFNIPNEFLNLSFGLIIIIITFLFFRNF